MSFFSAIVDLFKAIFKAILNFIKKILKKLWLVILIIVIIYFAPAITAYLSSIGAPSFLTSAFSSLSALTPYVTSALAWLKEGALALIENGWTAWKTLEFSTQLSIIGGAAMLIAPEEATEVVEETVDLVGGAVGGVIGGVIGALTSSPVAMVAAGFAIWWFFVRKKKDTVIAITNNGSSDEATASYV